MPVGSTSCSLLVYKWVPRDATEENPADTTTDNVTPETTTVTSLPEEENSVSSDSVEKTEDKSLKFPATQFLQTVS